MPGSKLNAATPGHENTVDIFGHSSGYFHGIKKAFLVSAVYKKNRSHTAQVGNPGPYRRFGCEVTYLRADIVRIKGPVL